MAREFYMTKDAPIVETKAGKLRDFHYDGVDHFYGIRRRQNASRCPNRLHPGKASKTPVPTA